MSLGLAAHLPRRRAAGVACHVARSMARPLWPSCSSLAQALAYMFANNQGTFEDEDKFA